MTEATVVTSETSTGVIAKPVLPSPDGKVDVLISMHNLWKTYDMGEEKVHALHGVSFEVKRGEYLAITGPSGSGKSTLMNLIGCLDTPSQGEYWLNGKNVSEMVADEPTGALDTATSYDIMNLFEKLYEDGNTIILVTHEHDIAARARRIISIRDGLIEKDETVR